MINNEGWKKSTIQKMRRLDSFLKESLRVHLITSVGSPRTALKPFTFSNGVTGAKGTVLGVPVLALHQDDEFYENASTFDGFRFLKLREQHGESPKYASVNTINLEYLSFGYGQHACPGRFFAVNEIKSLLAYTLLNYDVTTRDGKRPIDQTFQNINMPDMKAEILFRRRR